MKGAHPVDKYASSRLTEYFRPKTRYTETVFLTFQVISNCFLRKDYTRKIVVVFRYFSFRLWLNTQLWQYPLLEALCQVAYLKDHGVASTSIISMDELNPGDMQGTNVLIL